MSAHWQYLRYVVRHKWFVLIAGLKLGVPLWQLLLHDWDKFLPDEWFPYVASFYGPKYPHLLDIHGDERNRALDSGHYKEKIGEAFDYAWLLHQKRNKHHHQWWLLPEDDGGTKTLWIPYNHLKEMLADWIGAGLAQGKPDTLAWYLKNRDKMRLHPRSREWLEDRLGVPQAEHTELGARK